MISHPRCQWVRIHGNAAPHNVMVDAKSPMTDDHAADPEALGWIRCIRRRNHEAQGQDHLWPTRQED